MTPMYWLMKSEPSAFSIDDLAVAKNQTTAWDGVRNYQARNTLRDEMKKGDQVFFYHSNSEEPGIVGIMQVVKEGYPDPTAFDPKHHHYDPQSSADNPRWMMVDVKLVKKFKKPVFLAELRKNPKLKNMKILQKGNRLSVTSVTQKEWECILEMSQKL